MFKKPASPSLAPAGSAGNVVVAARCQQVGKAGGGRFIVYASLRDGQPPFVAQFKLEQLFVTAAHHDQFRASVYQFAQIVRGQALRTDITAGQVAAATRLHPADRKSTRLHPST